MTSPVPSGSPTTPDHRFPVSGASSSSYGHFICDKCKATSCGRNLVVAIDGTSNQYGRKNTNVIEVYGRVEKDDRQLTYYNSGIGTWANPSQKFSLGSLIEAVEGVIDLAFATNFHKIVIAAYRWLSDNYKPGDQIFLFGFSRGGFQAQILAAMIAKVGLIHSGNTEQIPFAFELYQVSDDETAKKFRETFSWPDAGVHFLGAWDTVSSVGLFRSNKDLPKMREYAHICYFRHALALDERRVKFIPECAYRPPTGTSIGEVGDDARPAYHRAGGSFAYESEISSIHSTRPSGMNVGTGKEHIKEVWFAGCHSDVGGGRRSKEKLLMDDIPAMWLANEARTAGLRFMPSTVQWNLKNLRREKPRESLRGFWSVVELMPFLNWPQDHDRRPWSWAVPHLGKQRYIQPGQKIHASVAFKRDYEPKAQFVKPGMTWNEVLGKGRMDSLEWAEHNRVDIELDLYDTSAATDLIGTIRKNFSEKVHALERLAVLAFYAPGIRAISEAQTGFDALVNVFLSEPALLPNVSQVLTNIAADDRGRFELWKSGAAARLIDFAFANVEVIKDSPEATRAILQLYQPYSRPYSSILKVFWRFCQRVRPGQSIHFLQSNHKSLVEIISHALSSGFEASDVAVLTLGVILENPDTRYGHLGTIPSALGDFFKDRGVPIHSRALGARRLTKVARALKAAMGCILGEIVINSIKGMLKPNDHEILISSMRTLPDFLERDHEPRKHKLRRFFKKPFVKNSKCCDFEGHSLSVDASNVLDFIESHINDYDDVKEIFKQNVVTEHGLSASSSEKECKSICSKLKVSKAGSELSNDGIEIFEQEFIIWINQALRDERTFVKISAISSLSELAQYDGVRECLTDAQFSDLLGELLKGDEEKERIAACRALTQVARNEVEIKSVCLQEFKRLLENEVTADFSYIHSTLLDMLDHDHSRKVILELGFAESLQGMLNYDSLHTRIHASKDLVKLAKYDDACESLLKIGLAGTLNAMLESRSESEYQTAFGFLLPLAELDSMSRKKLFEPRLVRTLGDLLGSDRQTLAVKVLLRLAKHDDVRKEVVSVGLIEGLKRALDSADRGSRRFAINSLLRLAEYDDVRGDILSTKVLKELLSLLGVDQEYAIQSILHLARHNDARNALLDSEMASLEKAIRKALESSNSTIRESTIRCLLSLAKYDDTRSRVLDVGLLRALQKMLKSDGSERNHAIRDLLILAKYDDVRAKVLETGLIEVLQKMLLSDVTRGHAVNKLSSLAEHDDARKTILGGGLVGALEGKLENPNIGRDYAVRKLLRLAVYDDARKVIFQSIPLDALRKVLEVGNVTREFAISELVDLAVLGDVRQTVLKIGIINALWTKVEEGNGTMLMLVRPNEAPVNGLLRLAKHDDARIAIVEEGIIGKLNKQIERYLNSQGGQMQGDSPEAKPPQGMNPQIAVGAIRALAGFAEHGQMRKEMLSIDFVGLLQSALETKSSKSATDALVALANFDDARAEILRKGVINKIKSIVDSCTNQRVTKARFDSVQTAQVSDAIRALAGFTDYDELRKTMLNVGCIESVLLALGTRSSMSAGEAITKFAKHGNTRKVIIANIGRIVNVLKMHINNCANAPDTKVSAAGHLVPTVSAATESMDHDTRSQHTKAEYLKSASLLSLDEAIKQGVKARNSELQDGDIVVLQAVGAIETLVDLAKYAELPRTMLLNDNYNCIFSLRTALRSKAPGTRDAVIDLLVTMAEYDDFRPLVHTLEEELRNVRISLGAYDTKGASEHRRDRGRKVDTLMRQLERHPGTAGDRLG